MIRGRARRKTVAWLAMLAICLLVVAPSISRITASPSMAAGMDDMCSGHEQGSAHDTKDHHHADALEACGYCVLVSHGAALGGALVFSVPALPAAPAAMLRTGRSMASAPLWRPSARGPPPHFPSVLAPT